MRANWKIGHLFGIPLYIDSSWLLILVLVTLIDAGEVNASPLAQNLPPILGWITGLVMALLLFGSVLLHELGHSLVAKTQGIEVKSITLFLFGGIASIARESKTPEEAFQVAIAGPLVSLGLFGLFFGCTQIIPETSLIWIVTEDLARINFILALFNLIPGLPLDGGQVLKALVWKFSGSRFKGMHWATAAGQLIGGLAMSLGLLAILFTGAISAVWMTLIGWFVFRNAKNYEQLTILQEVLLKLTAKDAMTRDFRVIDGKLPLGEFAQQYLLTDPSNPKPYYAASEGRYRGLINTLDLQTVERSLWESTLLETIAHPLTDIPAVQETSSLVEVIDQLEVQTLKWITVLSPAGTVSGVIDRGDVVAAIAMKQKFSIPREEIKRIKTEGTYPPGLRLGAIAQTLKEENMEET